MLPRIERFRDVSAVLSAVIFFVGRFDPDAVTLCPHVRGAELFLWQAQQVVVTRFFVAIDFKA